jgi:hypothetical protein
MPPMNGMYNIQEEPRSGYTYYRTVRRLPSPSRFGREREEIAELLRRVISGYLEDNGSPEYNEILEPVFDDDSIGESPPDRTMCFFVGDLDVFTPGFIRLLRERVLTEYPLWRLLAQFEEKGIGIYPQGAWLGGDWVEGEFDGSHPSYRAWFQDAEDYRERRYGTLRRQLDHVRRVIPAALGEVRRSGFTLLGAFDRYQPPRPGQAIWLLQSSATRELSLDIGTGPIRTSPVGEDGSIYPQFCKEFSPYTDVDPPFWLVTYLADLTASHVFVMKNSRGEAIGTVSVAEIVEDDT